MHLAGYTFDEKVAIANRFLVPKQIGMNGLKAICRDERGNTERDRYRVDKRGWGEEFGEGYCRCCEVQSCIVGRMGGEA